MKNKLLLLLAFLMISVSVYGKEIIVNNGEKLNVDTITVDNRTLLKLRDFSDILQLETRWNQQDQCVEVKDNKYDVKLYNNKYEIIVNGETKSIDSPPVIRDGMTYVPLRVIGNALGYVTGYENNVIKVTTRKYSSDYPVETIEEFKECIDEYSSLYNSVIEKMPFSLKEESRNIESRFDFLERKLTRNSIFLDGKETTTIINAMDNITYFVNLTSKDYINYDVYYNEIKTDYLEVMKIADKVIKSN